VTTHSALGVDATSSWTGILTTLADASLIGGAFGTQYTLWPAVGGQTDVELQAGTDGLTVEFATLGVGTTW